MSRFTPIATIGFLALITAFSAIGHAAPKPGNKDAFIDSCILSLLSEPMPFVSLTRKAPLVPVNSNPLTALEDSVPEALWQKSMSRLIRKNREIYGAGKKDLLRAPSNKGDPILAYLRNLGMTFGQKPKIPTLESILSIIIDDTWLTGKNEPADRDEIFLPALIYAEAAFNEDTAFNLHPLEITATPPNKNHSRSHGAVLTSEQHLTILMKGYQPFGAPEAITNYDEYMTVTSHDLVHAILSAQHRGLTKVIRDTLRQLGREYDAKSLAHNRSWMFRFGEVTETLELTNQPSWEKLRALLVDLVPSPDHAVTNYRVFRNQLYMTRNRDPLGFYEKVFAATEAIGANWNEFFTAYGGSAADPGSKYNHQGFRASYLQAAYRDLAEDFRKYAPIDIEKVAQFLALIINLRHITAEEFTAEALSFNLPINARIRRLFCESEVWSRHSETYINFCRGL